MRILLWLALCLLPSLAMAQTGNLYPQSVHASGVIKGLSPVGTQSGSSCTLGQTSGGCAGLADGDCGSYISFTGAGTGSPATITVTAPNSLPVGCQISLNQNGTGTVRVTAGSGAIMNTSSGNQSTSAQFVQLILTVISNSGGSSAIYNVLSSGATSATQTATFTSDPQLAAMYNIYGNPFVFNGLWNFNVGTNSSSQSGACGCAVGSTCGPAGLSSVGFYYDISVQFPKSGNIASLQKYLQGTSGYASGNGGLYAFTVVGDDGGGHADLSNVLGGPSNSVRGPNVSTVPFLFTTYTFSPAVPVTAGTTYHFVTHNADADTVSNCSSMDDIALDPGSGIGVGRSPSGAIPINQMAVSTSNNGTTWSTWVTQRPTTVPLVSFAYTDGTQFGYGYYEMSSVTGSGGTGASVGGVNQVRQTFTVSGNTMTVSSLKVAAQLVSGSGTMTATVAGQSATGSAISTGANNGAQQWISFPLSPPITLAKGTAYNLVLTAPAGTAYTVYGDRDGQPGDYQFNSGASFHDGGAQYSTNSGGAWTNYGSFGDHSALEADIFFFFQ